MKPEITIRDEAAADVGAITEVTVAAFKTLAISNHTEQFVIEALRAANALTLSLVAEMDGRVVGHIAFSPVTISDGSANWYGRGPVMANGGRQTYKPTTQTLPLAPSGYSQPPRQAAASK